MPSSRAVLAVHVNCLFAKLRNRPINVPISLTQGSPWLCLSLPLGYLCSLSLCVVKFFMHTPGRAEVVM
jgi:hypothetical protein